MVLAPAAFDVSDVAPSAAWRAEKAYGRSGLSVSASETKGLSLKADRC